MRSCHYCGQRQPKRKLRPLELSAAGPVVVCRDTVECQDRARVGLLVPTRAPRYPEPSREERRRRRRSFTRLLWLVVLLIVGLLVLPHVAIGGHHYRFFVLP